MSATKRLLDGGVIVDLGCGLGHDLGRLTEAGFHPIGLDLSQEMLSRARELAGPGAALVRAGGRRLPFRSASVDGCRIDRVLQHVDDVAGILDEVSRVIRPGGVIVVFEPDYGTFRIESDDTVDEHLLAHLVPVRRPRVGAELAPLLQARGFDLSVVVTEESHCNSLESLPLSAAALIARGRSKRRVASDHAARWLAEQRERSLRGTFRASWHTVLVLARRSDRDVAGASAD